MNFLYPGFLFALLAIAIPILIHLFNFRKFKKVYFSNVQFLKEVKERNSSREKLKSLLILFSRILAVIFLVFAFARPFIQSGASKAPGARNLISVYIDNSYSMETVNKDGSLLDEAKRKAKQIAEAYQLNDKFRILTNDFEGRHQRFVTKDEFVQLIDEVKISPSARTLQQVINRLQNTGNGQQNSLGYLISDYQNGFVRDEPIKTTGRTKFSLIKLNATSLPNISVDSIWSLSPAHRPESNEKIVVQLRNYSDEDAADIPVKLNINQQQRAIGNVEIPAGKAIQDTLTFTGLKNGWQRAVVTIKDFPLTFDDVFNFSFQVKENLKVLNIKGGGSERYIRSLFEADPYFKLTEMPETNIEYSTFSDYSLIILNSLKTPSSGLSQQLKNFVNGGGSLVIFPDLDGDTQVYTQFLKSLALPGVTKLNSGGPIGSSIDLKHPLFKDVFGEMPRNLDLPVINRYFSFAEQNTSNKQNILQLPPNQLLFAQYNAGIGKIFLSAVSLNIKDSNLPTHPVFLPLIYKIAFTSVQEQPLYYIIGQENLLEQEKITIGANQTLKLVSPEAEVIPEVRQTPGKTLLYVADQIKTVGFYDLRRADSLLAVMSFNDSRIESEMHYKNENDLRTLFEKNGISVYDAKENLVYTGDKNNSTELWKLCLILTAVFLAVEILLIRFFNKTKNKSTT